MIMEGKFERERERERERDHFEGLGVNGIMILKLILKKLGGSV
jgi:hypothetical protein